jgi:phage gpG-like protein
MIKVTVVGADHVALKLDKVAKAVKNLKPVFEDVSKLLIQEYKANFPAAGGVLKQPGAARKYEYPWPLLMHTGKLRGGFEGKPEKQKLSISNTVEYAQYQHFGMPPQTGKRPLVGITPVLVNAIKMRIIAFVKNAFAT